MHRWLLPLLVCSTVAPAPQDNSDITYVKIQPLPGDPLPNHSSRESRIQILPLSIGGTTPDNANNQSTKSSEITTKADVRIINDVFKKTITTSNNTDNNDSYPGTNSTGVKSVKPLSDQTIDAAIINKLNRISPDGLAQITISTESLSESNHDKRFARNEDFTTANYDAETTEASESPTVANEARTKPPRYISKLSYFHKTTSSGGSINLLETGGKKRFRSKCRCEKIWNCPKLQITVPRCPNEYFLCCF
ncbi:uncharacterized protein LOC113510985 [Galleria mellonella]|uniref:Uncharacterized protein LOC113510985 n=1 Tax=Galleria mellonella TaxID=7137 RepID=A0A6J3BTB1_GALME|nr:uncharacterized protein LOC113510985 [Galleria mellonella]